ncbi:MAG: 5-formyltetrahydrofolate cyclo-ligase [Rhodobacteraceae bacterium]|nr:5-formyltetrahydrofolate cyclo-ligase [Paracoccaceae bacterium]
MTSLADEKQLARKAGFAQRKLAHHSQTDAAGQAAAQFMRWLGNQNFNIVAGYMPIRTEIDVLPLMHTLHLRGMNICVPVIVAKGMPLKFRQWTPSCDMENGPFGAPVPTSGDWLLPDLMLCPLISFDLTSQRLGYGGGFYDRSLEQLRAAKPVTALGYAYAGQQVDTVPSEHTDQPLDGMVTERGVTMF